MSENEPTPPASTQFRHEEGSLSLRYDPDRRVLIVSVAAPALTPPKTDELDREAAVRLHRWLGEVLEVE